MVYDKLKLKVGIFVLILLLNVLGVISYIFYKKGAFEKRFQYNLVTHSAESFSVGMPVKVSGFKVGRVDEIILNDDGSVKVIFSVNEKNQKWVAQGSILMVRKPLLGSSYIILYSAIGNPILKEGTVIDNIISNDINDLILKLEPIVIKLGNIVNSVDTITSYLSKEDSELMKIIQNLEEFTSMLAKNESLLTSITGDEKATQSFVNSLNKLNTLMGSLNKVGVNVNKEILPSLLEFIKELKTIAKDIEEKLKKLDSVVNTVSSSDKDIIEIKKQVKTTILKTNSLIEKVDTIFEDEENKKVSLP